MKILFLINGKTILYCIIEVGGKMNYPNKMKKSQSNNINYGNRGMSLESEINSSNEYYLLNDIAIIHKKPTPITINRVNYKSRCDAVITEAHFKIPSTTDYNGIYKGKYIDFEAKETKSKTSFCLNNIHKHQIEHLKKISDHGGIGFVIIRFTELNETYFIEIKHILSYIDSSKRKSIPLDYIKNFGYIIRDKYNPIIDYIEIIDKYILKEIDYEKK